MLDSKKERENELSRAMRKQKRALLTRQHMILAAKFVFSRKGFEHARVEDIAFKAGKTRGAFYDNFRDKEDVFFAIFEEDIERDYRKLQPLLKAATSLRARVEALIVYLTKLASDKERTLLYHEFKLYAIRHPHKRKRLAELHAAMRLRCAFPELQELLPDWDHKSAEAKQKESLIIGAIMDGLALNHLFDPESLEAAQCQEYLRLCVLKAFHLA